MTDTTGCYLTIGSNIFRSQADRICEIIREHEFIDEDEAIESLAEYGNIHIEEVEGGALNSELKEYLISEGITFRWTSGPCFDFSGSLTVYCAETGREHSFATMDGEIIMKYTDRNNADLLSRMQDCTDINKRIMENKYTIATTGHEQVALAAEQKELADKRAALPAKTMSEAS